MKFDLAFAIRFLLAAMAVYRVAYFTREEGPFGIFSRLQTWLGKQASRHPNEGLAWTLAEIANCPHCFGLWLAILFAPAVIWPSIYTDGLIVILALAGMQSYLTGRSIET